ncbi:MAG: energy-coupling factor ABC transporter permease [Myxococcales bacterium]|jgi:cobalt/nickel transport system permease protein|nr:energy-coupling factor ABC transporter permease [Myxococcales bacterium]
MHIPAQMLNGAICPVSMGVAALGVVAAAAQSFRDRKDLPSPSKFALTGAAVFGLQMLNYPIWEGISGHLLGGVLAAALLGVPAGLLVVTLVVAVQALVFADGGVAMIGANVLNMALLGAGVGGLTARFIEKKLTRRSLAVGIAAGMSVMLAALALCVEIAASGRFTAQLGLTLLGAHAVLALIEGVATALLCAVLGRVSSRLGERPTLALLCLACLPLSSLASSAPDAFEWTMARFGQLPDAPLFALAPFADYVAFGSPIAGAALGLGLMAALGLALGLALLPRPRRAQPPVIA